MKKADLLLLNAAEVLTCAGPAHGIAGEALAQARVIRDGAVAIADGRIAAVGSSSELLREWDAETKVNAAHKLVTPGLVDPHVHLVFGGDRHIGYEAAMVGTPHGGLGDGIKTTVMATRHASDRDLTEQALRDLDTMLEHGTTTTEAKTGYGLSAADEFRILQLTTQLRHAIDIVPTFLALHVPPAAEEKSRAQYIEEIQNILPEAAKIARFCDVTADPVGFTAEECIAVGKQAKALGLDIRIHADQTGNGNAAQVAQALQAASADHLDYTTDEGLRMMKDAGTVGILFPSVTYHLGEMTMRRKNGEWLPPEKPFMPQVVQRAIDAGCVLAMSTDYNPGTSPTLSMQAVMQTALRMFRLSYAQIWNMCTLNAAASLNLGHDRGSLEVGKRADLVLWDVPTHGLVINRFGHNMVNSVWSQGSLVFKKNAAVMAPRAA